MVSRIQHGLFRLGYVKGGNAYLDILSKQTGNTVDLPQLNTFLDKEINENKLIFLDEQGSKTENETDAKYKLIKTGLKNDQEEDIYASFSRTSADKFSGAFIGTYDYLMGHIEKYKDVYNMGLISFESIELANHFIDSIYSILLPGENWSFTQTSSDDKKQKQTNYPILENYIKNVYLKLIKDYLANIQLNKDKLYLSQNSDYVYFNTGLLNRYVQDICIVGRVNKRDNIWYLVNPELAAGKSDLVNKYNFASKLVKNEPDIVSFFENINEVIFKADQDKIDAPMDRLEHIIEERNYRFPQEYQEMYKEHRIKEIAQDLSNAIHNAIIIAKRNYKYIVPQYRPKKDKIQFLMPIYLKHNYNSQADFALVLDPQGDFYKLETILPLEQAYNNARLIAKPDDLWLDPSVIKFTGDNEDGDEE